MKKITNRVKTKSTISAMGCLPIVIIMAFNILCGTKAVDYILSWFGKDIPMIGDMVIGLFTAQFTVPIAIIGWVLKICGIF